MAGFDVDYEGVSWFDIPVPVTGSTTAYPTTGMGGTTVTGTASDAGIGSCFVGCVMADQDTLAGTSFAVVLVDEAGNTIDTIPVCTAAVTSVGPIGHFPAPNRGGMRILKQWGVKITTAGSGAGTLRVFYG